jgi:hypothetical protein
MLTKKKRQPNDRFDGLCRYLLEQGCFPSVYLRAPGAGARKPVWRAHVNMSGNRWDEGETPSVALHKAIAQWEKDGKPIDGMAATVRASKLGGAPSKKELEEVYGNYLGIK